MKSPIQKSLEQAIPFLVLGIAIALMIGLFVMLSYIIVWGLVIGAGLWLLSWVKDKLLLNQKKKNTSGRIIEHNDK